MVNGPDHRVESLPLRSVWPKEQQDFSTWLVENIDFLNEQLPFDLDPESLAQEQGAGDFFVDVVGDAVGPAGNELKVVIENQLEETDHKHLGQILTYVSAFDADAAIWISARARPEHAKAVQWMNDESGIEAWLFDIEVIRIGESPPAPLLRQIIGPSLLSAKVKRERQASAAYRVQKEGFWAVALPLIQSSCSSRGLFSNREASGTPYYSQKANGPASAHWQVWVTSHGTWLCLRIHGASSEESAHYFDQLVAQKNSIESLFGGDLLWEPLPEATGSVIRWDNTTPGGYQDDTDQWREAGSALGASMSRFVEALQEPVMHLAPFVNADSESGAVG